MPTLTYIALIRFGIDISTSSFCGFPRISLSLALMSLFTFHCIVVKVFRETACKGNICWTFCVASQNGCDEVRTLRLSSRQFFFSTMQIVLVIV